MTCFLIHSLLSARVLLSPSRMHRCMCVCVCVSVHPQLCYYEHQGENVDETVLKGWETACWGRRRGAALFAASPLASQGNISLCLSLGPTSVTFFSVCSFCSFLLLSLSRRTKSSTVSLPAGYSTWASGETEGARPLLCGQAVLSENCSVIASKLTWDRGNWFHINILGPCRSPRSHGASSPLNAFVLFESLRISLSLWLPWVDVVLSLLNCFAWKLFSPKLPVQV